MGQKGLNVPSDIQIQSPTRFMYSTQCAQLVACWHLVGHKKVACDHPCRLYAHELCRDPLHSLLLGRHISAQPAVISVKGNSYLAEHGH